MLLYGSQRIRIDAESRRSWLRSGVPLLEAAPPIPPFGQAAITLREARLPSRAPHLRWLVPPDVVVAAFGARWIGREQERDRAHYAALLRFPILPDVAFAALGTSTFVGQAPSLAFSTPFLGWFVPPDVVLAIPPFGTSILPGREPRLDPLAAFVRWLVPPDVAPTAFGTQWIGHAQARDLAFYGAFLRWLAVEEPPFGASVLVGEQARDLSHYAARLRSGVRPLDVEPPPPLVFVFGQAHRESHSLAAMLRSGVQPADVIAPPGAFSYFWSRRTHSWRRQGANP